MNDKVEVAKVGRKVGLKGYNKLNLLSDFPEFITPGRTFEATRGQSTQQVTVAEFDPDKMEIRFEGIRTPEEATTMTNLVLLTTEAESRQELELEEGEYFWFDVMGMEVFEGETLIGKVIELDDFSGGFVTIAVDGALRAKGYTDRLILPWHDRFVLRAEVEHKRLLVQNALEILDAL